MDFMTDEKLPFVLVVDDVLRNLQVIGNTLEDEGYEISVAQSGPEALEMIKLDKPDLILLDVMMPDMNGFEVCETLKADDETKNIPVIFLTAKTETEDIIKGFKLGGVDYISKPFKKEELLVRIQTHLDLKFAREKIEYKNDRLEQLNMEKNEFLGIAAHDLKNPLTGIKGLSELIVMEIEEMERTEIEEFCVQIKQLSEYMFQIIVDLLDINAIEEGKINLTIVDFPLEEVITHAMEKFNTQAKKKNITLHLDLQPFGEKVLGDANRTQQVLDNLISNAIKFSPFDKKIWISSEKHIDGESAIVEIRDEGPGISKEDKKKLFGKFARLSAQPTGNENSTGLGLSIVKKIVEAMDGAIWCESEPGKGASFKFTLPIKS